MREKARESESKMHTGVIDHIEQCSTARTEQQLQKDGVVQEQLFRRTKR